MQHDVSAVKRTWNEPLANGSSSDTAMSRSEARGGTAFAGGTVTSSYSCDRDD